MEILALSSSTLAPSPRYAQIERRRAASASVPHSRSRSCLGAQDRPYRPPFLIRLQAPLSRMAPVPQHVQNRPENVPWVPSRCSWTQTSLGLPTAYSRFLDADSPGKRTPAVILWQCGSHVVGPLHLQSCFRVTFERHGIEGWLVPPFQRGVMWSTFVVKR